MMPIHYGQLVRFEHVKKKISDEITSFEERLTSMVLGTQARIITEMSLIKGRLDEHRKNVRLKLNEYVKKIASDLANLKRWNFQWVHNDLYEFEHILDQINSIFQGGGYGLAIRKLWKKFVGDRGEKLSDSLVFVDFLKKLKDFQKKRSTITPEIRTIREKIRNIRKKIKGISFNLATLQSKIPNIKENDYRDWKIMDAVNKFRTEDEALVNLATSVYKEIEGVTSDFEKIQVMKELSDFIKTFENPSKFPLLSYIKEMTDAPALLRKSASRVDELGLEIKKVKFRLENAVRINGYLKATDQSVHFKYEEPRFESLDKIDELISTISKNVEAITDMEGWIKLGFKNLKQRYVTQYGPAGILDEPTVFKEWFPKVKEELEKNIEILKSIKSIHEQLKKIKETAQAQDEFIKKQMSEGKLDSSSLEKIKETIDGFVMIRSSIDAIVSCFKGKSTELNHIKANVEQLKSLKPYLTMLKASIHSDIMFANIIEKLDENSSH